MYSVCMCGVWCVCVRERERERERETVRLKRLDPPLAVAETDDPWVERSLCGKDPSSMPTAICMAPRPAQGIRLFCAQVEESCSIQQSSFVRPDNGGAQDLGQSAVTKETRLSK